MTAISPPERWSMPHTRRSMPATFSERGSMSMGVQGGEGDIM